MESIKHNSTPVTELPNETTTDIDLSDSTEIVRLLRQCDAQIFSGWRGRSCLYDNETLIPLETLSREVQEVLKDPNNSCVVFSGCGTSGRIGFMLAKRFNALAEAQGIFTSCLYKYLIAGGDLALFASVEMPEDDYRQGQVDLERLVGDKKKVVFVGITCGLSAPYVAGQLDYCMDKPDTFVPALLGFNPVELARKTPIEGWSKTFFDVANRLSRHKGGIILNPVVGPEAITGSSRMKGASATKIILETALIKAHTEALSNGHYIGPCSILPCYETVFRQTYLHIDEMSKAITLAGESLRKNGHVYYLTWGFPGFMALLDASECVPTFSASFDDVRAFVNGGFEFLGNREGVVAIGGSELHISIKQFLSYISPNLTTNDTVLVLCLCPKYLDNVTEIVKLISKKGAKIVGLLSQNVASHLEKFLHVSIKLNNEKYSSNSCFPDAEVQECLSNCLDELAVKWVLNAISTGAHVHDGKVLRNLMIDLKVSNSKLFRRAVGIVSTFSRVDENEAEIALLKAIYRKDVIPESTRNDVTSSHVVVGSLQTQVVPLAVLLATGRFNIELGLEALQDKTVAQALRELHLL